MSFDEFVVGIAFDVKNMLLQMDHFKGMQGERFSMRRKSIHAKRMGCLF